MPRREDLHKIMLIGSGPIVIGQACEFDYSGTQGAKALREEGYEVVLVNSNPATIMTDPEFSDRTYIEPLTLEVVTQILERERPDALLPTLGGQTALNLALELHAAGVLERLGVALIGASVEAIRKAEEREEFKAAMERIGLECCRAKTVKTVEEGRAVAEEIGFPIILRPSLTMGGMGGGIVESPRDFETALSWALQQSPVHECLVEESIVGWKEFELEVIRDRADNFAVICTIENVDPMGVHTGDSVTVAPAMTLTDREYQRMRDAARKIISEIGVDTGGSNIQFAVDPATGRLIVIEMNPRVSRSSALASKATGYPIAKIAAKLAIGYTLDELKNDITGTSAAFEPTIDYVVVKWPRFAFEKFEGADPRLTTQMKSVGEVMAIGRTFKEAFLKAARSLEIGRSGVDSRLSKVDYRELADQIERLSAEGAAIDLSKPMREDAASSLDEDDPDTLKRAIARALKVPLADRFWTLFDGLRVGLSVEEICEVTGMDPWFVTQFAQLVEAEAQIARAQPSELRAFKRMGFSDATIASLQGRSEAEIREARRARGLAPTFSRVDTCAAEFEALTPYLYSTYGRDCEAAPTDRHKVLILGGGPNRIGQGIEFDYCCTHAAFALRALGFETIMVNCNPETVSTDFDTSDRLYFEPLSLENVLAIAERERPGAGQGGSLGVIVQLGGQTPLNIATGLEQEGLTILGTPADAIDRAEDRERFEALLNKLGLRRPRGGIAKGVDDAFRVAAEIGYPVVVRPSYVLGGRAMEIVYSEEDLASYMRRALEAVEGARSQSILVDEFLQDAMEVDVDAICDGQDVIIGGILQHIEEAGIHSGDSAMVLPPHALPPEVLGAIRSSARALALELGVIGLMNVQFAVRGSAVYVIEVNPRASRTIPFVSKATGLPLAQIAAKVMVGKTLKELGIERDPRCAHVAVKESVFPFAKFPGVDTVLSPEMRSTGEVMGIASTLSEAFLKASLAAGQSLPVCGNVFVSVRDADKLAASDLALRLVRLGFSIVATEGTQAALERSHVPSEFVHKVSEGSPDVLSAIAQGQVQMVINTSSGPQGIADSRALRAATLKSQLPYFTTIAGAAAGVDAIEALIDKKLSVAPLQELHAS